MDGIEVICLGIVNKVLKYSSVLSIKDMNSAYRSISRKRGISRIRQN